MKADPFTNQQFTKLEKILQDIKNLIRPKHKPIDFIDNQQFIMMLSVSKRTAQHWRDSGKISYSQIGSKVYYKLSDVECFLKSNYVESYKLDKNEKNH